MGHDLHGSQGVAKQVQENTVLMSTVSGLKENKGSAAKRESMKVQTVVRAGRIAQEIDLNHGARPLNVCMIGYTVYESDGRVMRYAETLAKRGDHVDFVALKAKEGPRLRTKY